MIDEWENQVDIFAPHCPLVTDDSLVYQKRFDLLKINVGRGSVTDDYTIQLFVICKVLR